MKQHELQPNPGSTAPRKRRGRGHGSGLVKTSGFGQKGQKARTGHHKVPIWFEGSPSKTNTIKRMGYKRGVTFKLINRTRYEEVNLGSLADWEGDLVTPETLAAAGYIDSADDLVKVLGDGDISKALNVRVHRITKNAQAKITAAGGQFEELTPFVKRVHRKVAAKQPQA
jgi:large subunit ribosomal protein L15